MTQEGNGEKPGQVSIFPSSAFTDLEDSDSRERFKALLKFQHGSSDEELDSVIDMLRRQERWNAQANFNLVEITDRDHEYFGRIGQLHFAMNGHFVGNIPLYKLDSEELRKSQANIEHKLALIVKVDFFLVELAEDGGQYTLLNKSELENRRIEVENEGGGVGVLLGWRQNEGEKFPVGFYTAKFGDDIVEMEDWLMMQQPTWKFRRA